MKRQLFITGTFALLLAISNCSANKEYLPATIYNHTLKQRLAGQDAIGIIDKMHFQAVAALNNEIGFYEGPKGLATIYITYYANSATAEAERTKMTQKISPENSVFIGSEYFDLQGIQIYRCFGMGQTHFVFVVETELIWFSVNTLIGKAFLTDYLDSLD